MCLFSVIFSENKHMCLFFSRNFLGISYPNFIWKLGFGPQKSAESQFFVVAWKSRISISFANKTMLNRNYSAKHHVFSVYNSEPIYKTKVVFFPKNKQMCLFYSKFFLKKCSLPKISTGVYIRNTLLKLEKVLNAYSISWIILHVRFFLLPAK